MTDRLVEADILIDIFAADPDWRDWSAGRLVAAGRTGRLNVNQIVCAAVASSLPAQRRLDDALGVQPYQRETLRCDVAFSAARAFLAYRRSGGLKRSSLPDFYIGTHAEVQGYCLLTRDSARYRESFPTLRIISPETHP